MANFLKLDRVYRKGTKSKIHSQKLVLDAADVSQVRTRAKFGPDFGEHATIVTKGGKYINVEQTKREVETMLGIRR